MATAAQRRSQKLFAKRAKTGFFDKNAIFSNEKIRNSGSSVKEFVANLRRKGYSVKKVRNGVQVNLRGGK